MPCPVDHLQYRPENNRGIQAQGIFVAILGVLIVFLSPYKSEK